MKLTTILVLSIVLSFLVACNSEETKTNYYENGIISSELHYKNGKLDGLSKYYYKNGAIQSSYSYKDGLLDGKSTSWYLNSNKETETNYKQGKQDGTKIEYNQDGTKAYLETYKNDSLDGEYISYHTNGKERIKGFYANGLYHGHWIYLDRFGRMVGEADFKHGSGTQKAYYTTGQLKRLTHFKNNKKNGQEDFYNIKGQLTKVDIYKNGIFIEESNK